MSQFADDTTVCLDGSEESLTECIKTLEALSLIAGLNMNNAKTQLVWIGSKNNYGIKYMTDRNFGWAPGIFNVLGIIILFSTDTERTSEMNYDGTLTDQENSK